VDSSSTISELEIVSVVNVVGEDGVLRLKVRQLLGESRVDFLEELGSEQIVGAGDGGIDGLGHWEDGTGLALHDPLGSLQWTVEVGQSLEGRVDVGVDIPGLFEPGGDGSLLPDGNIGVSAVEKETEGSITDFWVLSTVESDRDEDGEDFLFDDLVGDNVDGHAVNRDDVLLLPVLVEVGTGLDQVLEGIDGLDLDGWVGLFIHDLLNDFDDVWVSEVTQDLEEGDDPVFVWLRLRLETFFKTLDEIGDKFLGNVLFVTELSVQGNWVATVLDTLVDTGVVEEGGEREHGSGADLFLTFDLVIVDEFEVFLEELLGGSADVHGEGGQSLGSLFTSQLTVLDLLEQVDDSWVGTSDGQSIQEDAATDLLLFISGLDPSLSNLLDSWGVEDTEDLDDSGDLGKSLTFGNGVLLGGFGQVVDNLLHQFVDALLHLVPLEGSDEHGGEGGLVQGWLGQETLSLGGSAAQLPLAGPSVFSGLAALQVSLPS